MVIDSCCPAAPSTCRTVVHLTQGFALDILAQVATINAFLVVIVESLWFLEMPTVSYKAINRGYEKPIQGRVDSEL